MPAFFAWLVAASYEHRAEILLRFVPANFVIAVLALAGKASVTSAPVLTIGLSLAMAAIEHVWKATTTLDLHSVAD